MLLLVAVLVVRAQALRTDTEACGAHVRAEQVVPERQLAPPFISSQTEMRRLESVVHLIRTPNVLHAWPLINCPHPLPLSHPTDRDAAARVGGAHHPHGAAKHPEKGGAHARRQRCAALPSAVDRCCFGVVGYWSEGCPERKRERMRDVNGAPFNVPSVADMHCLPTELASARGP